MRVYVCVHVYKFLCIQFALYYNYMYKSDKFVQLIKFNCLVFIRKKVLIAFNLQTIKIIKHETITTDTIGKTIAKILFESSSLSI